jgi:peptide chain release factor 1
MSLPNSDLKIEYLKGSGKGGQRKNKVESACRITHLPTGLSAFSDMRLRHQSKAAAFADLVTKVQDRANKKQAALTKARRDEKVTTPTATVRTYNFSRDQVKDHRTGKSASIKDILEKGDLDKLR